MIAFVCHPYHRGGVTRWMVDMAIAYADAGRKVFFVTVEPVKDFMSAGGKETVIALLKGHPGVQVVSQKANWSFEFGSEQYRAHVYATLLSKYVLAGIPAILSDDAAAWRVSRMLAGKYIFVGVLHSDDEVYYSYARDYHAYTNKLVCVSNRVKNNLGTKYKEININEVEVIPCGIPLPPFSRPENKGDILKLAYVGRIGEYQKRTSDFVPIVEQLSAQQISFHLDMIGDGDDRTVLADKFKQLGLQDKVSFPGWLAKEEINRRLFGSDIVVLTSDFEGMPIAAMEGLSTGCAVVSTRVSGVEDIETDALAGKCVWLNDIGDTNAAVNNIKKAMLVPYAERVAAARQIAEERYDIAICMEKYDKAIERSVPTKSNVQREVVSSTAVLQSRLLSLLRYAKLKTLG